MVKKVVAIITLITIVVLIGITFVMGIIGSDYFWGMFFASFMTPIIIWAIFAITKGFDNNKNDNAKE